jgi:DNA repair exonuclease SbcCD nuclease subunit
MERGKVNKPDLLLTGDWHLREDTPTCFTGDFQKEQWDAVQFISELQEKYDIPVICSGDLFHHWKPSPWLLSQTLWYLPNKFCTIYGQHDLPQHNWDLREKSGIHTLQMAGKLYVLPGCHYGETPEDMFENHLSTQSIMNFNTDEATLVWHHLTYITEPYPGATGGNAYDILNKYKQFKLIVTGDNHCSFTIEKDGRRLVNTGNLTRQTAAQIDFKPCVWLWYAESNTVEQVFLPIEEGVVSREHLQVKEERNERIDAFISKLSGDYKTELSFEANLESFFQANEVKESVRRIVYKAIE